MRRIPTACFEDDRGVLCPIDFADHGFVPLRAFVVSAPAGAVRGGHGHRRGRQILLLVSGEIDVEVAGETGLEVIRLDRERRALIIEPPVSARQIYRGEQPAMVVFCDTAYDPGDYVCDAGGLGGG